MVIRNHELLAEVCGGHTEFGLRNDLARDFMLPDRKEMIHEHLMIFHNKPIIRSVGFI